VPKGKIEWTAKGIRNERRILLLAHFDVRDGEGGLLDELDGQHDPIKAATDIMCVRSMGRLTVPAERSEGRRPL